MMRVLGASEGLSAEVGATQLKHPTQCLDGKLSLYRWGAAPHTPVQITSRHCCTLAYMGTGGNGGGWWGECICGL